MEITEFIEQDILIFLDDRLDKNAGAPKTAPGPTLFLTKDYEKELMTALEQNNVASAKQVLHHLKEQLDISAPGTDKEQLKALLTTLYERFKDYIDNHHLSINDPSLGLKARNEPEAIPQEAEHKEQAAQPPRAHTPEKHPEPPVQQAQSVQRKGTGNRLNQLQAEIEQALAEGATKRAMLAYRSAKQELAGMAVVPHDVARTFLALFHRIKEAAQPAQSLDKGLLLQLEQEKQAMDTLLRRNDVAGAQAQYQRMQLLAQQLHDQAVAHNARQKLQRIEALLNTLQRQLARAP